MGSHNNVVTRTKDEDSKYILISHMYVTTINALFLRVRLSISVLVMFPFHFCT